MKENTNPDIVKVLLSKCEKKDGKLFLTCGKAAEVAKQEGTSLSLIGSLCEKHKIKINSCQLKCF